MHNTDKAIYHKKQSGAHDDARRRHLLSTFVLITENKEPKKCRRLDIKDRCYPTILNAKLDACVLQGLDMSFPGRFD